MEKNVIDVAAQNVFALTEPIHFTPNNNLDLQS
jgi:hypothetical protein